MSTLVNTIQRGIDSATYNQEAETAAIQRTQDSVTAKSSFKKTLDTISSDSDKQTFTDVCLKLLQDILQKANLTILKEPSDLTSQQWIEETSTLNDTYTSLINMNKQLSQLIYIVSGGRIVSSDLLRKTTITQPEYDTDTSYLNTLETWLGNLTISTLNSAFVKQKQLQVISDIKKMYDEQSAELILNPDSVKNLKDVQEKMEKGKEIEDSQFNITRLFSTMFGTTMKVIIALLYVTLALVAGMLCANDSIGRSVQYRVLYFIYGAIFAPIILIYYLYRWMSGSAPRIYRLLPITTIEPTTDLGKFFLFPFLFEPDTTSIELGAKFVSESANAVAINVGELGEVKLPNLISPLKNLKFKSNNLGETISQNTILQGVKNLQHA